MLVLFAPAVALAGGGGGGNGNGGVGIGVGGRGVNTGIGVGAMGGIGHGPIGAGANGIGSMNGNAGTNGNGRLGDSTNDSAGVNGSGRVADDTGPTADSDFGSIARAREDDRRARAELKARAAARLAASSDAHGKAVSAEAHLAKTENDGDKVGEDVSAVARDRSTLPSHATTTTKSRMTTKVARTDTRTHTHPVNHGAAVSAEAHLAKTENDGDKVGEDVSAVARDRSTLPTHATTTTKSRMTTKVASTKTSTNTHPVNHGAAVSAEAHLAKTENDGDKVGEDVSAVARDKSTLKSHTKTHTKVASTKTNAQAQTKSNK